MWLSGQDEVESKTRFLDLNLALSSSEEEGNHRGSGELSWDASENGSHPSEFVHEALQYLHVLYVSICCALRLATLNARNSKRTHVHYKSK